MMTIAPNTPKPTQRAQGNRERRAWDGKSPHADAARQRLLEAAARCIERDGIAATTVGSIATEAGVSRQTVYRYFNGRDEVVLRSVRLVAEGLRAKIDLHIRALASPADMIVESFVISLVEFRNNPVLRAMMDPSRLDESVTSRVTKRPGIEWAREALAPAIEAAGWSEADATVGLELILRMFLSLIISPSPERNPEELRAFLYRHLIPGLGVAATEEL